MLSDGGHVSHKRLTNVLRAGATLAVRCVMAKLPHLIAAVVVFDLLGCASAPAAPSHVFRKPTRMSGRPSATIAQPEIRPSSAGALWMTTPPNSWGTVKVTAFDSSTSLGKPFHASAVIESDSALSVPLLLGKPVVVGAELPSGRRVLVHGYVSQIATSTRNASDHYQYDIQIEPWLQAMARAAHFRVFHDRTAPEILEEMFRRYPTASYRMELTRDYPIHETMLQYRETDLNFVQRLMEHVGIYYAWEHSERGHVLVLRDSNAPAGLKPKVTVKASDIDRNHKLAASIYTLNDFDVRTPGADLTASARAKRDALIDVEVEDIEVGTYRTPQEARWFSAIRLDELRAKTETITVPVTYSANLEAGVLFDVGDASGRKQTYLVTESELTGRAESVTGRLAAIPVEREFRPSRQTPWPQVSGTLVATVLEPPSNVDGVTRCKLEFPWPTGGGAKPYLWGVVDPGLRLTKGDYVSAVFMDGSAAQPVVTAIVRRNAH